MEKQSWLILAIVVLVGLVSLGAGYILFSSQQQPQPVIVNNTTPQAPINNTVVVQQKTTTVTQPGNTVNNNYNNVQIDPQQAVNIVIQAGVPEGTTVNSYLSGTFYDVEVTDSNGDLIGSATVDANSGQILTNDIP